jgi:TIR domain
MSEQRVFLSYSADDRPLVESAVKWLRESELGSADVDDPAKWGAVGDDVRTVIRDRIRRADTVVLVWSDRAAKSAWVQYQVGMAQALDVPIRVLVADDSQAKLPMGLGKTKVIKLEPVKAESHVAGLSPNGIEEPSLATALRGLAQQYQRIEDQVQQVRAMLEGSSSTEARRTNGGAAGKPRKQLSAAARKRIVSSVKRRWKRERTGKAKSESPK